MNRKTNLGEGSIGKLLLSLAVPTVAAQIVNLLYSVVDRIYIGNIEGIGALGLTGVGLCFPIIMIVNAFSLLMGSGGAPRAAIAMGKGDNDEAENILGNCFTGLVIASIIITTLFFIFGEQLLFIFGASEHTIVYATDYLYIYLIGTTCVMMTNGLNAFITTQGYTKYSMLTVMIGAGINIILDPIFIFGLNMGIKGAALATIISQTASLIWVIKFLTGKKTVLTIKKVNLRLKKRIILPVIALGISPFVMASTESLLNISFNISLSRYGGDLAVGAMTILSSVFQMCTIPAGAISQGAQPIISYNYGARKLDRVRKAFKLLLITNTTYTTLFFISVMLFAPAYVGMFNNDPELMEITVWALRIYAGGAFMMGVQNACQNSFLALGQAKISLFLACLRKLILLIPLIYILPNFFEDKLFAVFLAEPVSDITAATCTLTAFIIMFPKILKNAEENN